MASPRGRVRGAAPWKAFPSRFRSVPLRAKTPIRVWLAAALTLEAAAAQAAQGVHWTFLGPNSVAFSWRGPETTFEYWTIPQYRQRAIAHAPSPMPTPAESLHREVVLTGLATNATYRYRIGDGPEHTFHTPPPPVNPGFWFAALGDIGSSHTYDTISPTMEQIASDLANVPGDDRPRFVLALGDLTYGDEGSAQDVYTHFDDVQVWSRDAAYMPAWGNHEWQSLTSSRPDNLNNYEGRFVLPNSQSVSGAALAKGNGPADDWGWFDYGNARFISMPADDMVNARSEWAAAVGPIMAEAQANPNITFIIVYGHFPAWHSGNDHSDDNAMQALFQGLRASHSKFVLTLHGHSHHYERWLATATGGITAIVNGGGGAACGGMRSSKPAGSAARANELSHVKIRVLSDRIEGWAICGPLGGGGCREQCVPGTILDQWVIMGSGPLDVGDKPAPGPRLAREGVYYDILGRRVQKPLKAGIYFLVKDNTRRVVVVR